VGIRIENPAGVEYALRDAVDRFGARLSSRIRLGLYNRGLRYVLRRDLDLEIERPLAKIPIEVRPMIIADLPALFSHDPTNQSDRLEVARRKAFLGRFPNSCYVAIDQNTGHPCYMQWLLGPSDRALICRLGGFPELREDEALLENAYTPARYRGLGIMSAAMSLIAEQALDLNADYVLTLVDQHNTASLKGCQRAGFYPHLLHHQIKIGFGVFPIDRFERLLPNDTRRQWVLEPASL
jgi:GNAT superfamily N-acetyltransferase